jgi:hypothetical protein
VLAGQDHLRGMEKEEVTMSVTVSRASAVSCGETKGFTLDFNLMSDKKR